MWNYCIKLHDKHYEWYRKFLSANKLKKFLTKVKKTASGAWIKELPSQSVQDVVERIDKACQRHFADKKIAFPSEKRIEKYKSFTLKQCGYKFLENNQIKLLGKVYKYVKSREIKGEIKTLTIKRDNLGNLWMVVVAEYERSEIKPASGKIVGFDFGMKHMLVGSDRTIIDFPLCLRKKQNELKKLNRALSRKKKGSNHRNQAKHRLAKFHQHIQNQRNDLQWKLARYLLSTYDLIKLEDLNIKGMSKHFGRKIVDYGFSDFVGKLKYFAKVFGKRVEQVPRFFASSKTCSNCGYVNKELKLKDREWVCPVCGAEHDRDFNAAVNILNYREGTSSLGLGEVRPEFPGICCLTPESPML